MALIFLRLLTAGVHTQHTDAMNLNVALADWRRVRMNEARRVA